MLNLHLYASFCILILIISFTPGPNVLLMVKYGMEHRLKEAIFPIPGIVLALLFYALIVSLGLVEILTKYPSVYKIICLVGACYLIYMGSSGLYKLYKNRGKPCSVDVVLKNHKCRRKLFTSGFLCAITNPKMVIIYLVLLPQFVDHNFKALPQFLILSLTHILAVVASMSLYCFLANKAQNYIKKYAKIQVAFTNLILIALGVFVLIENNRI
ncbi:MAG: LysE family translocator [Bdellovibrionota bacterium]